MTATEYRVLNVLSSGVEPSWAAAIPHGHARKIKPEVSIAFIAILQSAVSETIGTALVEELVR
jgi:hypothetical protein